MKFKVDKNELLPVLEMASRFVSRNSTLPVLENVSISWNIDTLEFKATDMNKYIYVSMPAKIESEWAITVNAKKLLDTIRVCESDQIKFEGKDDWTSLTVFSWKDKFDFKWISINEYVAIPESSSKNSFNISLEVLSKWIERVESSIPDKSFTTIITWMLIKGKGSEIAFVGTDSFRLAEYKINYDIWKDFDVVIPKSAMLEVKKVADLALGQETSQEDVNITYDEKLVNFSYKLWNVNVEIKTNLIKGAYPDYEKIILPSYNSKIIINKSFLEKALKKVSLFSKDISYYCKFTKQDDELIISSGETDFWEWVAKIDAIFDWDISVLWLNWKSLLDFLKYVEGEEVILNVFDDEKPILLKDQWDEWYRFVVRPFKD